MEHEGVLCHDDEVLLSQNTSPARFSSQRVWPWLGAVVLVAGAGCATQSSLVSSGLSGVTSLFFAPRHQAWRVHHADDRVDAYGCMWDGDDCRSSRCCAKEGSRCFMKSRTWASCNETCHYNVKWGAGLDGYGRWAVTNHRVWDCTDLTVSRPQTPTPKAIEVTTLKVTPTPAPAKYHFYDDDLDNSAETLAYPKAGDERQSPSSSAAPASTTAAVRWHS